MSADRRDFLDEIIDERRKRNPDFLDLVEAESIATRSIRSRLI
jgi:hypothetical protein